MRYNHGMFQVVASDDEAAKIRDAAKDAACGPVAVRYSTDHGRGPWFQELTTQLLQVRPEAAIVRVPTDPDRVERALLELAAAAGPECLAGVANGLRSEPDAVDETLARLVSGLGDRPIVVDGLSALQSTDEIYDAGHALDERFRQVHRWLAKRAWVVTDCEWREWRADGFQRHDLYASLSEPPTVLQNGSRRSRRDLWDRFAPDVGVYNAALALLALQGKPDGEVHPPAWKIRDHVVRQLPDEARELLFLLGVHARPLPDDVRSAFDPDGEACALLHGLGLCERSASGYVVEPAWARWCVDDLGEQVRRYHARLAEGFASQVQPEDKAADRAALAVLEAHRHYVALGDDERARRFARYSCALLVEEGKRRSLRGRFEEAARLYDSVLSLADAGALPLAPRLRGYVRHYVHFNRAKAKMESLAETERGYRASVGDWRENALFWSRLVRAQVYADKPAVALKTLDEAHATVPEHDEKEPVLIARTVRGLLQPSHGSRYLIEAVWVWGKYRPTTSHAESVEDRLRRALASGWSTQELALPDAERVVFARPQRIKVLRSADIWIAELVDLKCSKRGDDAKSALEALLAGVRDESRTLISTLTHTLDAERRLRKQILLGAIDIIASGLDAAGSDRVWVMGDIVRAADQSVWLRTRGSRDLWFAVSDQDAQRVVPSDRPYLAEVIAGGSGVPHGPVTKLVPAYSSPEEVWRQWRRRMNGDD